MDDPLIEATPVAVTGFRFGAHTISSESASSSEDSADNNDFSNAVLKYISDILMEEELDSKNCILQDCLALQAAEKSLYDVLGQKYPPWSDQNTRTDSINLVESSWMFDQTEFEFSHTLNHPGHCLEKILQVPDLYSESFQISTSSLILSESEEKDCFFLNGLRERKHHDREANGYSEGRSNKHSAYSFEKQEETEIFDEVLLNDSPSVCNSTQNGSDTKMKNGKHTKGSNGRKGRSKKNSSKKEIVDLWTLLPQCAQAVASDDQRTAKDLLRQIRQYSSPFGDGNQRLAHFFANGLEARLAGIGTPGYTPAVNSTTGAADMLKAYHIYISTCPFQTMSHLYANQTIMKLAEKVTRLHIIDFGILYGFQWPCLIEHLSTRTGGPPKLCITGIEFPQPGFRPADRVEETGRRLRKYCERFHVPFEYHAIAQKWESIQYEDFKIDREELIVVNCLYRLKNLPDDTMVVKSVRDKVLNLMRQINPHIFIHGVVNGTYNAPFFLTRFRDALFHFSAMFDLLDATIPREEPERRMFEEEIFGRYAMNVIACEGGERVERPETYRQWQVRNGRAGFRPLPLDKEIMKKVISTVRSNYNSNFVVDEDSHWMLQGWKGRIIYALSVWKPAYD